MDSDDDSNFPSRGNRRLFVRVPMNKYPSNGNAKANHKRQDILDEDTGSRPCGRGHIYSC